MLELLLWILGAILVVIVLKWLLDELELPQKVKMIVLLIVAIIVLIVLMRRMGVWL